MGEIIKPKECYYYQQKDRTIIFVGNDIIYRSSNIITGLDDRVKPEILRMFLSPNGAQTATLGIYQMVEFLVNGKPVPPSVISKEIAYMDQYMINYQNMLWSSNMISPDRIKASSLYGQEKFYPYGQYNDALHHTQKTLDAFQYINCQNGCIFKMPYQAELYKADCPFIKIPIGIDFTSISVSDLRSLIASGHVNYEELDVSQEKMYRTGFYNILVENFQAKDSDFDSIEFIGENILFQINDSEQYPYYYMFFFDYIQKVYHLYSIDSADMISLKEEKQLELIERINDYFESQRTYQISNEMEEEPAGRGQLFGDELLISQADELTIEMKSLIMGMCAEHDKLSNEGIMVNAVTTFSYEERDFNRPNISIVKINPNDYANIVSSACKKFWSAVNESQSVVENDDQRIWFDTHSLTEGEYHESK